MVKLIRHVLKPANIEITPEGVVRVLDFGLAKAAAGDAASGHDVSQSPTVTVGPGSLQDEEVKQA